METGNLMLTFEKLEEMEIEVADLNKQQMIEGILEGIFEEFFSDDEKKCLYIDDLVPELQAHLKTVYRISDFEPCEEELFECLMENFHKNLSDGKSFDFTATGSNSRA